MRRAALLFLLLPLTGCGGIQSMTGGDGAQGAEFNSLFILFMVVTGFVYLLVIAFLIAALLRRGGKRTDVPDDPGEGHERGLTTALVVWTAFIAIGLTVLTFASYFTDRSMAAAAVPANGEVLNIEITANQWWWDIRYHSPTHTETIRTANELHLPVGIPAHIQLRSTDVIHSFWVPNLAGKQDLIPGRLNDIDLLPRRTGLFRGQCAEYCGTQHAHMALDVTVESRDAFRAWWRQQAEPAKTPTTPLAMAGYNYVMQRECSVCHNISGTGATGQVAPDLTHVASRKSLAAGTLPMGRGQLYAWIADPQGVKPGNNMPYIGLEPQELHAVVAYLETLK
jgi:cytochrome c oxidase subunit 2